MKELGHRDKKEVFEECGVEWGKRNSTHNIHHIIFKSDVHHGDVDRHFPLNARSNLVVLPIPVHKELHDLVERTPAFKWNTDSRIWLANYAYNGELDLL